MAARRSFHFTIATEKQPAGNLCPSLGGAAIRARVTGRREKITADDRQRRQRFLSVGYGQPV